MLDLQTPKPTMSIHLLPVAGATTPENTTANLLILFTALALDKRLRRAITRANVPQVDLTQTVRLLFSNLIEQIFVLSEATHKRGRCKRFIRWPDRED